MMKFYWCRHGVCRLHCSSFFHPKSLPDLCFSCQWRNSFGLGMGDFARFWRNLAPTTKANLSSLPFNLSWTLLTKFEETIWSFRKCNHFLCLKTPNTPSDENQNQINKPKLAPEKPVAFFLRIFLLLKLPFAAVGSNRRLWMSLTVAPNRKMWSFPSAKALYLTVSPIGASAATFAITYKQRKKRRISEGREEEIQWSRHWVCRLHHKKRNCSRWTM